jgi:hypothetical protein
MGPASPNNASARRKPVKATLGLVLAVVPVMDTGDYARRTDEPSRALRCFPGAVRDSAWFEDDGSTDASRDGVYLHASFRIEAGGDALRVVARRLGGHSVLLEHAPLARGPAGDARNVITDLDSALLRG